MKNFTELNNIINIFNTVNVLCVGDMMLDEYISGPAERLSPEAPVPVIRRKNIKQVLGGVGNVAANLAALGCGTSVFYAAGDDTDAFQISKMLVEKGINGHPTITNSVTTKKQRIMAHKQQICRVDTEEPLQLTKQQEDKIIYQIKSLIPTHNIVLLSDYNKGFITPRIAQEIIKETVKNQKYVLVDPKGNDYSKYKGATLIKPNLNELKTAIQQMNPEMAEMDISPTNKTGLQNIKELAIQLRKQLGIQKAVVTLSENGMLGSEEGQTIYRPTLAHAVYDVSGAGDTSLAVLGAALGSNTSLENALDLANIGAGIVVAKEGTATLSTEELRTSLKSLFHTEGLAQNFTLQKQNSRI